jgi:hypothetical protein
MYVYVPGVPRNAYKISESYELGYFDRKGFINVAMILNLYRVIAENGGSVNKTSFLSKDIRIY